MRVHWSEKHGHQLHCLYCRLYITLHCIHEINHHYLFASRLQVMQHHQLPPRHLLQRGSLAMPKFWKRWEWPAFLMKVVMTCCQHYLYAVVCCLHLSRTSHARCVEAASSPSVSPTPVLAWCLPLRRTARHAMRSWIQPSRPTASVVARHPMSRSSWQGRLSQQRWTWVLGMVAWRSCSLPWHTCDAPQDVRGTLQAHHHCQHGGRQQCSVRVGPDCPEGVSGIRPISWRISWRILDEARSKVVIWHRMRHWRGDRPCHRLRHHVPVLSELRLYFKTLWGQEDEGIPEMAEEAQGL